MRVQITSRRYHFHTCNRLNEKSKKRHCFPHFPRRRLNFQHKNLKIQIIKMSIIKIENRKANGTPVQITTRHYRHRTRESRHATPKSPPPTHTHAHAPCSLHSCRRRHPAAAAHSPRDHSERPKSAPSLQTARAAAAAAATCVNRLSRLIGRPPPPRVCEPPRLISRRPQPPQPMHAQFQEKVTNFQSRETTQV